MSELIEPRQQGPDEAGFTEIVRLMDYCRDQRGPEGRASAGPVAGGPLLPAVCRSHRNPPLRDRREDISPLSLSLLNRITAQNGLIRRFSPQAMRRLLDYSWPGNVRELANVIEYAVTVAGRETILPEDLPEELKRPPAEIEPAGNRSSSSTLSRPGGRSAEAPCEDLEIARLRSFLDAHQWCPCEQRTCCAAWFSGGLEL
jgi:hypothetical protein